MKLIARLALAGVLLLGAVLLAFALYAATVNVRTATVRNTDGTHDTAYPAGDKPVVLANRIKFQPGWYPLFNKTCVPVFGAYGCSAAEIVNTINTEICPNANLVGLKILGGPLFFMSHTPGVYTATGPDSGFAIIDPVLAALQACGKFLMIQGVQGILDPTPNNAQYFFPKFTFPSSFGTGGTAAGGEYGVVLNTQGSQGGLSASIWKDDWRDLAIATVTAYCNRYESNPAFYAIGIDFWNTSIPFNPPYPPGYDIAAYHNNYRAYLSAARAACPTTNILATLDYADPHPSQMSTYLASVQTSKASMANNDVSVNALSWGQEVYTGFAGSPSVIDYRGVVRYMEEIESPDMCGTVGNKTPTQIFDVIQNGNGSVRARWSNTIVVSMATECPAGYDWTAWKTFIAGKSGQVMDARGPTLRTPAYIKANSCESSMVCQ